MFKTCTVLVSGSAAFRLTGGTHIKTQSSFVSLSANPSCVEFGVTVSPLDNKTPLPKIRYVFRGLKSSIISECLRIATISNDDYLEILNTLKSPRNFISIFRFLFAHFMGGVDQCCVFSTQNL